jgi:hypothetical protein
MGCDACGAPADQPETGAKFSCGKTPFVVFGWQSVQEYCCLRKGNIRGHKQKIKGFRIIKQKKRKPQIKIRKIINIVIHLHEKQIYMKLLAQQRIGRIAEDICAKETSISEQKGLSIMAT